MNTTSTATFDATSPVSGCAVGTHVWSPFVGRYRQVWLTSVIEAVTAAEPTQITKPRKRVSLKSLVRGLDEQQKKKIESVREDMVAALYDEMSAGRMSPLTYYRTAAGLTQTALAEKSGFHQSKISTLESNASHMTARAARQLAAALNIDFHALLV